ncbi:MAG TPA: TonB-dependent receptor [Methylophilaceae bacterium]
MIMRFRFFEKINTSRLLSVLYEALVLAILIMSLAILSGYYATNGFAADKNLNTSLPKKHYTIPAGSLGKALAVYASEAGVILAFDPAMTDGKTTLGINGEFALIEGFNGILKNSGLEIINSDKGDYTLKKVPIIITKPNDLPLDIELKETQVIARRYHDIGPLPGLGLTKDEIPGNVQSLSAKQIKESRALSIADLMNSQLQSVNVNDYQGNPFQMDVMYRGFTASPQLGTSQGLSVFLDGIRVNEPFGDVVNWDMIPMNALNSFDVFPGSNPIFGLGTLGGALSMRTKNGFDNAGVDTEVKTGSYGRKQFLLSTGANNGVVGGFLALNLFDEDGWRVNSPSEVNQAFGKLDYRSEKLNLGFSTLIASNDLVGNGLVPTQMYQQSHSNVFSSPDETKNKLLQFQLTGEYFLSDSLSITGQLYRRDSRRKTKNGDVYTPESAGFKSRRLNPGETPTCVLPDLNKDGLPDYYVDVRDPDGAGGFNDFTPFVADQVNDPNFGQPGYAYNFSSIAGTLNETLPDDVKAYFLKAISQPYKEPPFSAPGAPVPVLEAPPMTPPGPNGEVYPIYSFDIRDNLNAGNPFGGNASYITPDGKKHVLIFLPTLTPNCANGPNNFYGIGEIREGVLYDVNNPTKFRDGANDPGTNGTSSGVIEGTPTAIITNTQINQVTDGGALQLNWNTDHHKLMVGVSLDKPHATYKSGQMLGLLDANRNAYLDPANLGPEYTASTDEIANNNFEGTSITKSLYFSETWSPVDAWHFTGAGRFNSTHIVNALQVRNFGGTQEINRFLNRIPFYALSTDGSLPEQGYTIKPDLSNLLKAPEKEKFDYYSFNPSLGATWQANEKLNIYSNWSKGARTPSVIELGCAYDGTLVEIPSAQAGGGSVFKPRSLVENRFCNLPSTLSGDPYLPQVRSTTIDIGARGRWGDNMEWNLGAYKTDLKDDIYFVSFTPERSFFNTIGNTQRQGLEAGLAGKFGKASFRMNYALTDATFQSDFVMLSPNNSSAGHDASVPSKYQQITVEPGDRMPGVPLHNLNATLNYEVTPNWQVGITMIMHSMSYLRGNENNKHQPGAATARTIAFQDAATNLGTNVQYINGVGAPISNPGTIPGYAVFNFNTTYKIDKGLTAGLIITNLFDRDYFSAGRLGVNPFSPSINGVVDSSGYNHNSNDWLSTNFLAPGAPRSIYFTLSYEFNPGGK